MNIRARLVPFLVLALLTVVVLPFRSVAQADSVSGSGLATNPLILKNSVTGAQVQIMPTTQWIANHASTSIVTDTGSTLATTSSSTSSLPAPTCTLATDASPGDAHVLVNTADTQFDSLDLNAFGLTSDNTDITGQISTESLSDAKFTSRARARRCHWPAPMASWCRAVRPVPGLQAGACIPRRLPFS